ncbi:XRE family transcriptional regulator [Gordonia effusa]|nr:XRE family transcriptional regulator [Gordonia effusa]
MLNPMEGAPIFEYTYVISPLSGIDDSRIIKIEDSCDAVFENQDGFALATLSVAAVDGRQAGIDGAILLRRAGFEVVRTYPDFVTRGDIAERAGKTRQAVGNWIRGDRQSAIAFPRPVNLVAGGIWLWGTVVDWMRSAAVEAADIGDSLQFPSIEDHSFVDCFIGWGDSQCADVSYAVRQSASIDDVTEISSTPSQFTASRYTMETQANC